MGAPELHPQQGSQRSYRKNGRGQAQQGDLWGKKGESVRTSWNIHLKSSPDGYGENTHGQKQGAVSFPHPTTSNILHLGK